MASAASLPNRYTLPFTEVQAPPRRRPIDAFQYSQLADLGADCADAGVGGGFLARVDEEELARAKAKTGALGSDHLAGLLDFGIGQRCIFCFLQGDEFRVFVQAFSQIHFTQAGALQINIAAQLIACCIANPTVQIGLRVVQHGLGVLNSQVQQAEFGACCEYIGLWRFASAEQRIGRINLQLQFSALALQQFKRFNQVHFEPFDAVLSPVVAHASPALGYLSPQREPEELLPRLTGYVGITPMQNVLGTPAISLPMGMTSTDRRPIGIQLSAQAGEESTLLSLAFELEAQVKFPRIEAP